jgi:hypothetical protein
VVIGGFYPVPTSIVVLRRLLFLAPFCAALWQTDFLAATNFKKHKNLRGRIISDVWQLQLQGGVEQEHSQGSTEQAVSNFVIAAHEPEHLVHTQFQEVAKVDDDQVATAQVVPDLGIAAPDTPAEVVDTFPIQKNFVNIPLTRQRTVSSKPGSPQVYKSAYYATFTAGTPAVDYTLLLDTGSGHMILPSTFCKSATCIAHKRYRASQSSSAVDILSDGTRVQKNSPRDEVTVSFGTGSVTGVLVEETICLDGEVLRNHDVAGNSTALAVAGQETASYLPQSEQLPKGCQTMRMIQATEMSEEPFRSFDSDGVLGLGLAGLSLSPEYNFISVFAGSVADLGGQPKMFAFFLAQGDEETSELALGGYDDDHVDGNIHWNPVLDPEEGHWMIRVKSISVDGVEVPFCEDGSCKAVLDSGTSLLAMPSKAFPIVYKRLWHRAALDGHCEGDGPQLDFEFEDFTVTLGPEDYARSTQCKAPATAKGFQKDFHPFASTSSHGPTRNDLCCRPMLMSVDMEEPIGPKLFLLGEPVLQKYYTVYDA